MNKDKLLKTHTFSFNRKDNGGEQVTINTKFYDNGDRNRDGVYINQEITLNSYCNAASILLYGAVLGPEDLRMLADELDDAWNDAIVAVING